MMQVCGLKFDVITLLMDSRRDQEMEKMQEKGEVGEAELRALEEDVTGKVCAPPFLFVPY